MTRVAEALSHRREGRRQRASLDRPSESGLTAQAFQGNHSAQAGLKESHMNDEMSSGMPKLTLLLAGTVALLILGALTLAPQARANQAMAKQTGKGCPTCHTAPPALNDTGKKFKANGNKF
jgi:hypothetical protein